MIVDIYIMGDQPTTCSKCGARTEILVESIDEISSITQHNQCLDIKCRYAFMMED
jgi:hypothetical protein